MAVLDDPYVDAVETIASTLDGQSVPWALTGSTSFAMQGVPVSPNDVDVQTSEDGAYAIERLFAERITDPVSFSESGGIRSHFGAFELKGLRVEIMGAVQKRRADGTWGAPVDVTDHRTYVDVGRHRVPVLPLQYEAQAYEQLGLSERAALLLDYAED